MYIVEIIAKYIQNRKTKKYTVVETAETPEYESCEHVYVAIDSTKDYLACLKCGNVIAGVN